MINFYWVSLLAIGRRSKSPCNSLYITVVVESGLATLCSFIPWCKYSCSVTAITDRLAFNIDLLICSSRETTQFWRWTVTEPSVICQANTKLFIPGFDIYSLTPGKQPYVAEEHSTIFLISEDRILYGLDLQCLNFNEGTLARSGGTDFPHQPYCKTEYRVSRNGSRVVGLYIRCPEWPGVTTYECEEEQLASPDFSKTCMELKIVDLWGTLDLVQTVEVQFVNPTSSTLHTHDITFSPDFSLLQAGLNILDLSAPGHPQLSFFNSPLGRFRSEEGSRIHFSPCNGYLIITKGKNPEADDKIAMFGLFRICRAARQIEKIAIAGLDGLVADGFEAAFHPIHPLLLLTYVTYHVNEVEDVARATEVLEIDLEAKKVVQLDIPKHGSVIPKQ